MLRALFCTGVLLALSSMHAAAASPAAAAASRLAIVPVSDAPAVLAAADLLTVALGKQAGIELVERAELQRVLKEQSLTAAGLTDGAGGVELGKLLRAAGLVLVEQDPRRPFVMLRLLETQRGYRAGYWRYSTKAKTAPELASAMAKDVTASLPKLALQADKFLPVSILFVRNATGLLDFAWIEDELPEFFAVSLAQSPGLVILERRQLQQAAEEVGRTAGGQASFLTGALLLDGEVAPAPGAALGGDPGKRQVVLRLRIRDAALQEIGATEAEGQLGDLETVAAKAAGELIAKMAQLRPAAAGSLQLESGLFLELARRERSLWAAESATALRTGRETRQQLVTALLAECRQLDTHRPGRDNNALLFAWPASGLMPREDALPEARLLARVADTCLAGGPAEALDILEKSELAQAMDSYLLQVRTVSRSDLELRGLLQPYRHLLRMLDEQQASKFHFPLGAFPRIPFWYDDPLDALVEAKAYLDPLFADKSGDPLPRRLKILRAMRAANFSQAPEALAVPYLKRLAADPDPFVRCFGCYHLARIFLRRPEGEPYATKTAECLVQLLDYPEVFIAWWDLNWQGLLGGVIGCTDASTTLDLEELWPTVEKKLRGYLEARRYDAFLALAPMLWPTPLPPDGSSKRGHKDKAWQRLIEDAMRVFNGKTAAEIAASRDPKTKAEERMWTERLSNELRFFCERLPSLKESYPGFMGESLPTAAKYKVLLSNSAPIWQKVLAEQHYMGDSVVNRYVRICNMMRDGQTLWVELGNDGFVVGLAQIDLPTGKVESLRMGVINTERRNRDDAYFLQMEKEGGVKVRMDYSPWCRWGDVFCFAEIQAGVALVPVNAAPGETRLLPTRTITSADGLPYDMVTALAGLGDNLYIAVPGHLLVWHRTTAKLEQLLDLASQVQAAPLPRHGTILGLVPSADAKELYVLVRYPPDGLLVHPGAPNVALWRYSPATTTWKEISPAVLPRPHQEFRKECLWAVVTPILNVPGDGRAYLIDSTGFFKGGPFPAVAPSFVLDLATGAFTGCAPESKALPAIAPLVSDGQLEIVRTGESWELRYNSARLQAGSAPSAGPETSDDAQKTVAPSGKIPTATGERQYGGNLQKDLTVDLGGGVKIELVLIPAGSFAMGRKNQGSPTQDFFARVHKVTISNAFYLGKYEVTQEQWQAVMGTNPSAFKGPKNPVDRVSWEDCQAFIEKLNKKAGAGVFRLPGEAEWEYACRAGTTTAFFFGDDEAALGEYAWYEANSGGKTHPVGQKKANAWGLFDMLGNASEWCQDEWAPYGSNGIMQGPAMMVMRGGSWFGPADCCPSAWRGMHAPDDRNPAFGFRLARTAP